MMQRPKLISLSMDEYQLWVRCRDWLPSHHSPGQFRVSVDGRESTAVFWESGRQIRTLGDGTPVEHSRSKKARPKSVSRTSPVGTVASMRLCSQATASNRRTISSNLHNNESQYTGISADVKQMPEFDVVVIGAGPAGIGAARGRSTQRCSGRTGARPTGRRRKTVRRRLWSRPMGYIGSPPDRINVTGLCEEMFPGSRLGTVLPTQN